MSRPVAPMIQRQSCQRPHPCGSKARAQVCKTSRTTRGVTVCIRARCAADVLPPIFWAVRARHQTFSPARPSGSRRGGQARSAAKVRANRARKNRPLAVHECRRASQAAAIVPTAPTGRGTGYACQWQPDAPDFLLLSTFCLRFIADCYGPVAIRGAGLSVAQRKTPPALLS